MDGERAVKQRLSLGRATGVEVDLGQSVERATDEAVLGAEGTLLDGERAVEQGLGFGGAAGADVDHG